MRSVATVALPSSARTAGRSNYKDVVVSDVLPTRTLGGRFIRVHAMPNYRKNRTSQAKLPFQARRLFRMTALENTGSLLFLAESGTPYNTSLKRTPGTPRLATWSSWLARILGGAGWRKPIKHFAGTWALHIVRIPLCESQNQCNRLASAPPVMRDHR